MTIKLPGSTKATHRRLLPIPLNERKHSGRVLYSTRSPTYARAQARLWVFVTRTLYPRERKNKGT